jgi:hypothetical protein
VIMQDDRYQFTFRLPGRVFGSLIIFFALFLFSVELGRLYSGSINRGRNDSSSNASQYSLYSNTVIGFNGNRQNPKIENRWMWPWSTATLLFSLVFVVTGALGVFAGQRESYSSILVFYICSIVSVCLLIYLVATYSTIIAGWRSLYGDSLSRFPRLDRDLSIVCLLISSLLFILFFAALVHTGRSIDICTQKYFNQRRI